MEPIPDIQMLSHPARGYYDHWHLSVEFEAGGEPLGAIPHNDNSGDTWSESTCLWGGGRSEDGSSEYGE